MFHSKRRSLTLCLLLVLSCAAAAVAAPLQQQDASRDREPLYKGYKGVRLGMTADEVRKALGDPASKGDTQDFYSFSDDESAQIFYGRDKKVYAVSVFYVGKGERVPTPKTVLGAEIEAQPDGSMHRKVDYSKAGFWVAYSRTSGEAPLTTVTIQASHKEQ
jgi:outer membrane protein assembly factor BamE (lipoprotein component of BamABCDE complex)